MESINNWLSKLKADNPMWGDTIDKIMQCLSERGFDSTILNHWIDEELNKIKTEYEAEFIQDIDDKNQDDTN